MIICIPMAGQSSRFSAVGYSVPKYMLALHGSPVFDHAVRSFEAYFNHAHFVFVGLASNRQEEFVSARCKVLGLRHFQSIELSSPTKGQAQTVAIGLSQLPNVTESPLTVFNIDSFRPNFTIDSLAAQADGYLEVFSGEGDQWSFVKEAMGDPNQAVQVAEKIRISQWCSNGLYFFAKAGGFLDAYERELASPTQIISEYYIAPLYNQILRRGGVVRIKKLSPHASIFCGTPSEYEALKKMNYHDFRCLAS